MSQQRNDYDVCDNVRREAFMHASGPGNEMQMGCYRVRNLETGEFSVRQFHFTFNNTVLAVMNESAAQLFARFITDTLEGRHGEAHEIADQRAGESLAREPATTDIVPSC